MYRLKSRIDLISARRAYSAAFSSQSLKILVCAGTGCVAGGSLDIYARLKELIDCTVKSNSIMSITVTVMTAAIAAM